MSGIFISHSSRDDSPAAELKERLAAWGHSSVFLDFDPEVGIPAGRDWEQELYHQLRTCRAVLVLCSEHSMSSHWCFAEITHAKSLGKPVFPLRVGTCEINQVLASRQVLDLTEDRETAFGKLERALKETLGEGFPRDKSRPPYPGLMAFQEEDAAIFFGRGAEIQEGLEALERLRRYGGGRALMVLGASGSGKSSLVRAGLLPRLRRNDRHWLVVNTFRPLHRPWRELAIALSQAFADQGRERDWRELQRELERAAGASVPSPECLINTARDLLLAAGREEARVLLIIDQVEELLTLGGEGGQARFAPLLQAALETPQSPLMAISTLRTDLLVEFQQHPATRDLRFDDLRIGPMSPEGLTEVIEAPAQVAGIDLGEGLSEAIHTDAASGDALPLLAFTLRELYERFGADRLLTLEEYRDKLGGLGGSVAQAAEEALTAEPLSSEQEAFFRDVMLSMVRLDEEGRFARRAVRRNDLPEEIRDAVGRFVDARLFVARDEAGERVVEVTHEVLFRSWDRLRRWLDENREFLLWRKRLDVAREEWERTERHESLLLTGPVLVESRRWLEQAAGQLEPGERAFLERSVRRETARKRRRAALAAMAALFLTLVAVGGLTLWRRAEAQKARAEDAARVAVAGELKSTDPTRAAQVLLLVERPESARFALPHMREVLRHRLADLELEGHTGPVLAVAFSPDGSRLASASADQQARIWRADGSGSPIAIPHDNEVVTVAFSPDGQKVLTVDGDGWAQVWPSAGAETPLQRLKNPTPQVAQAGFDPRGDHLLVVANDGTARVLDLTAGGEPVVLGGPQRFLRRAGFAASGDRVVSASRDGAVSSWRIARPAGERPMLDTGDRVLFAELSPLGNRLFTFGKEGGARVWHLDGLDDPAALPELTEEPRLARFSPLGDRLLTAADSGEVRLWELSGGGAPQPHRGPEGLLAGASFDPHGKGLMLVYESGAAFLWRPSSESPWEELRGHTGRVLSAAFSPTGDRLATGSEDGRLRIWKLAAPWLTRSLAGPERALVSPSFSPDGSRVLSAEYYGSAWIWPVDGEGPVVRLEPEEENEVIRAVFDASGERVLVILEDGSARFWDADGSGGPVTLPENEGVVVAAVSPRDRRVATASRKSAVRVWAGDGSGGPVELGTLETPINAIAFGPAGRRVAAGSISGEGRIWNADGSGEPAILKGHEDEIKKLAFSPDGTLVATVSKDRTARVWPADGTGKPLVLSGHDNDVVAVAFDPRQRLLATGSNDSTVRVWDLADPAEPYVMERHSDRITSVSFSPSGEEIISTSSDGTAMVWRANGSGEPLVLSTAEDGGRAARVTGAAFSADGAMVVTASVDATARLWLVSAAGLRRAIEAAVSGCLTPDFRRAYLGETDGSAAHAYAACRRQRGRAAATAAGGGS